MDQMTQIEPARIDDLIATYREFQAQFERVRERLRRAEEHRGTVEIRIYDRVRAEYDRELDSIRARMSPLRDEITRIHESLEAQCRDAASMVQAVEEELAEAEFRHLTGEFEDAAFAGMRHALDARATEARARHTLLQSTLTALGAMRRSDGANAAAVVAPAVVVAAVESTPVPDAPVVAIVDDAPAVAIDEDHSAPTITLEDVVPPRPVLSARRVYGPTDTAGFENPHDWISEMGSESARRERRGRISPPPPTPAPLPAANESPVAAPVADYPSLVFVSGPHAGQAVALLPTTLSLGREHDNNIEIKDPDVARYHARILRERDQYVVEDLNSSTGTWVNGERRQRSVLTHGDVIRLGQTELAIDFEWTSGTK